MNEIETILCQLLSCNRSELYLDRSHRALTEKESRQLESVIRRRMTGEPLQYLLGNADFMGLTLSVKPGILIPRPETEVLVEQVLAYSKTRVSSPLDILDIGTGSGNIAISLAAFLPARAHGQITAVDISETCLSVARSNARRLGVADKIVFRKSDLFSGLDRGKVFDIIVSNPPYVSAREYRRLPLDVRQEPRQALLALDNGFYFYKKMEQTSRDFLAPCGKIFLEIGEGQRPGLCRIFRRRKLWSEPVFVKDMAGRDRVCIVSRNQASLKDCLSSRSEA